MKKNRIGPWIKFAVLFIGALTGCATPPIKSSSPAYMGSDSSKVGSASATDIRKDLYREWTYMVGIGIWGKVTAYPVTDALIETEAREDGRRKMDDEASISREINSKKTLLTKNRTCFYFTIKTSEGNIASAKFVNWTAKIEDEAGKLIPVGFTNISGLRSIPRIDSSSGSWENWTYGCVNQKFDLTKRVKLHIVPPTWSKAERATLGWYTDVPIK